MTLNKKGFTLIEVIIALSIMTTVIFIAYKSIDKIQVVSKDQSQISDVQNGFNNLKRHLSDELKVSKNVKLKYSDTVIDINDVSKDSYKNIINKITELPNRETFSYSYIIEVNSKDIDYNISVYKKGNQKFYSIDRIDDKVKMNLIINQPLNEELMPLKITHKDDLYSVELNYIKQNTKLYSFDVYNRKNNISSGENNNPTEPESPIVADGYFGYCISQSIQLLTDSGFNSPEVNKIKVQLKEILSKDINSDKENMEDALKRLQSELMNIITSSSDIPKNSYDYLNKALYYMYAGEETLDEIDEKNDDSKAKDIATNIHNGIYDDNENGNSKDTFVKYLNDFSDSIKHHGNGVDVEYATKLSAEVKINLDSLWKYVNKVAGSDIFNIIHSSWMGISNENKEHICRTMNTVIDKVIDAKVYIDKVIREDILKEGNIEDVKVTGQKLNDELEDLIDALINIKAYVYSSNFYAD